MSPAWYRKAARVYSGHANCRRFCLDQLDQPRRASRRALERTFPRYRLKIHFTHRTFAWESEARGKAHVHVVIIGFAAFDTANKRIYDYENGGDKVTVSVARNISPYLVEAGDVVVLSRSKPLCAVPEIVFGNMPNDGGHLILTEEEKTELLRGSLRPRGLFARSLALEFINGQRRWCLWLVDATPADCAHAGSHEARRAGAEAPRGQFPSDYA